MPGPEDFAETYVSSETLDRELETWMEDIKAYQWREAEKLIPQESALLVVDMNKAFVDQDRPLASPNSRAIVPRLNELVTAFRQANRPVIWIIQGHHSVPHDRGKRLSSWWPMPILEGTPDVEIATGLEILEDEKVIMKRRYSGFYQTDLELTLRNLGISQVVVTGVLTQVCPYTTAFDAFFRDLCVFYPADATASINRDLHVNALRVISGWCGHVVRSKELIASLN